MRCIMGDIDGGPEATQFMHLIFTHFRSRMDAPPLLTDEQLQRLTMPVLLMAGANDNLFDSQKTIARLQRLVEGADARLLPGASHALINVAAMVVPFLAGAMRSPERLVREASQVSAGPRASAACSPD